MRKRVPTEPGRYYGRDAAGGLHRTDAAGSPDVVMCRRVSDYPLGLPPIGARVLACSRCSEWIAADPAGPHQAVPHACMQCCGVQPLPFPPARD